MGLLAQKRAQKEKNKEAFAASSNRTMFLSMIVLLLVTAIIAVIALALFYSLNCRGGVDYASKRSGLTERYNLVQSELGGCVGKALPLFNTTQGASYSMLYLIGEGEIKPWQYVGHSPLYLHFHEGSTNLKVYLWDEDGNSTEHTLGPGGMFNLQLPPFHWHAWKPENEGPYVIVSVITPPGTPNFSQRPVTDFSSDPLLQKFENETLVQELSTPEMSDYCVKMTSAEM